MEEAAERVGGSFFILPSSLHEILIIPDDGNADLHELENMVREVNSTQVAPEERLSDNVYHYDAQEKLFELGEKFVERQNEKEAAEVGNYTARAISFSGNNSNNYIIKSYTTSVNWSIRKTAEGNSFTSQPTINSWTYGEVADTPKSEAKFGTPHYVYSDNAEGIFTGMVPSTAGTWYMKAVVEGTDNYGTITSAAVEFEIKQAKLTVIADDISSARGENLAQLTYKTSGNIKSGDNLGIELSTTATRNSVIGEYPITVTHNGNSNYDITVQNGTYFIIAGTSKMQVTASGYNAAYDGNAHGISVAVKGANGAEVSDAVVYYSETELTGANYGTGSTESPTLTNVGSKTVYYYVASDSYEPISGSKQITVSKKSIAVIANDAKIVYGEQPNTNGAVYRGFVNGDTAESLGFNLELTTDYEQYESAGGYIIRPQGLPMDGNYSYEYKNGNLTVEPKEVRFAWTGTQFTYDGATKSVVAEVSNTVNSDVLHITYEENPASGTVQTAVIKEEEGLPPTEIETNLTVAVAEALLTEEEVEQVKTGEDALIYLVLSEADTTVNESTEEAIKLKAEELESGTKVETFLDLSLFKQVGNQTPKKITQVDETEVTIEITIPESLKLTDSNYIRTYNIIFEHEGAIEVINPQHINEKLIFKANKFSIYAIAYKDTAKTIPGGNTPGGSAGEEGDDSDSGSGETPHIEETTKSEEPTQPSGENKSEETKPEEVKPEETKSEDLTISPAETETNKDNTKVETPEVKDNCYWHWIILLVTLIGGIAALLIGKKNKKYGWLILIVSAVSIIVLAILGECLFDWIFAVVGIIIMLVIVYWIYRNKQDELDLNKA